MRLDSYLLPADHVKTELGDFESCGDIKFDIEALLEKLQLLGLETLPFDYSRAPMPIKSTKVFIAGLCYIPVTNQSAYVLHPCVNNKMTFAKK